MSDDFGARLIQRLEEAADRNRQVLDKNVKAKEKMAKTLATLSKTLQGNQVILRALREIYGALEADGEELQATIIELKEAKDCLEIATNLLNQANYDFANIQSFSKDEVWLAEHPPTIRRALEIFNLNKLKVELDTIDKNRRRNLKTIFIEAHD
jgi:hypothetical protein